MAESKVAESKLMEAALRMEKRQMKAELGEVYWDGKSEASDFVRKMSDILYAKDGKQNIAILRASIYKGVGLNIRACRERNAAKGENRPLEDFMDLHQRRLGRQLLRHFLNLCYIRYRANELTEWRARVLMDEMATGAWVPHLSDSFPARMWSKYYSLGDGHDEFRRQPGRLCIMPPVGQRVYLSDDEGRTFQAEVVPSKMVPEKARAGKLKRSPHTSFYLVGIGFDYVGGVTEMARAVSRKIVPTGWNQWQADLENIGPGTMSPEAVEALQNATLIVKKDVEKKTLVAPPPESAKVDRVPLSLVPLQKAYEVALPPEVVSQIEPRGSKKTQEKLRRQEEGEPEKGPAPLSFPVEVWQALRDDEVVWPDYVFTTRKLAEQWGGGGDAKKVTVICSDKDGKDLVDKVLRGYVEEYEKLAGSLRNLEAGGVPVDFDKSIVEADVVKAAARAVGYTPRQAANYLGTLAAPESEPEPEPERGPGKRFLDKVRDRKIVNGGS